VGKKEFGEHVYGSRMRFGVRERSSENVGNRKKTSRGGGVQKTGAESIGKEQQNGGAENHQREGKLSHDETGKILGLVEKTVLRRNIESELTTRAPDNTKEKRKIIGGMSVQPEIYREA